MRKDVYIMIIALFFFLFAILTSFGLFTFLGWMAVIAEFGYIAVKTW